jgi:hypothetical protein
MLWLAKANPKSAAQRKLDAEAIKQKKPWLKQI